MKNKYFKESIKGEGRLNPTFAFTLVELLVVIAIIAILAAMLMPVINKTKTAALKTKAKTEEVDIANAINAYESQYGRFPETSAEQIAAGTSDFTTGLSFGLGINGNGTGYSYNNNSNVVAMLMDLTSFPNGAPTSNASHVKNPKQTKFLNAKISGYDPTTNDPHPPSGVDNTGIYRDPWGNPYIITMDFNYDDSCSDFLYSLQSVSQNPQGTYVQTGFYGLSNPNASPSSQAQKDNFLFRGKVMVWSAGPDGKYDNGPANIGFNKDNVLSWQ